MRIDEKVCMIGLGYIGLPTAALLANRGYRVHGVDVSAEVVDIINRGQIHIVEPDLDTFVQSAVNSGRLKADTEPTEAGIFIIAVPTPFCNGYEPDLSYVRSAAKAIAPYVKPGNCVVLESTSPVGTTEEVAAILKAEGVDVSAVHIAHCPERVLPGHIMRELVENDRIVGGLTPEAGNEVADFYRTFVKGEVVITDARTAEMTKLTENSFRDVNIAFANELSVLCDKFEIDVWELIRLANRHPRVNILNPGPGVGGHCIAVDPWFIVHAGGEDARLIRTGREVNNGKTDWAVKKVVAEAERLRAELGREPVISCMGLAFKANIDDLRESPALSIYKSLVGSGLQVLAVEPNLKKHKDIELTPCSDAAANADLAVFLVAHREFDGLQVKGAVLDFCGVVSK